MTNTGIVFISYGDTLTYSKRYALSSRENTLTDMFEDRFVADPFNKQKGEIGETVLFESFLDAHKYYEGMKYVLRKYSIVNGKLDKLLDEPRIYTEMQAVKNIIMEFSNEMQPQTMTLSHVTESINAHLPYSIDYIDISYILQELTIFTDRETPLYAIENTDEHIVYLVSMLKARDIHSEFCDIDYYSNLVNSVLSTLQTKDCKLISENFYTGRLDFKYKGVHFSIETYRGMCPFVLKNLDTGMHVFLEQYMVSLNKGKMCNYDKNNALIVRYYVKNCLPKMLKQLMHKPVKMTIIDNDYGDVSSHYADADELELIEELKDMPVGSMTFYNNVKYKRKGGNVYFICDEDLHRNYTLLIDDKDETE